MFVRSVATRTIAKAGFRILVDVPGASMTKVRPLAPCLISASSRSCLLSILPSRLAPRRKACPLRNCPRNMNSVRRPAGSLNGRYSKRCKALATIRLQGKSMWTSSSLAVQRRGCSEEVVVALEIVHEGFGRAYAEVIDDASAKSLRPFFERRISKDAEIITDEWNGYKPLKKDYPKLTQVPSDKGNNFPQLHIHIMNIKGWLRGIHHHCSKERLQGYLDEYHFRFNRRAFKDTIFDVLIRRMVFYEPKRLK